MKKTLRFAPPNLIFFLEDASGGKSPEIDDPDVRIWASPTTVIVGCLPFIEGDTNLMVSTSMQDAADEPPRFECIIATPSRKRQVTTSEMELLMQFDVAREQTAIRIWTNDPLFPDQIFVVLD